MLSSLSDSVKDFLDAMSVVTVIAIIKNLLPIAASVLTIVWTSIRIYDYFEKRWKKQPIELED